MTFPWLELNGRKYLRQQLLDSAVLASARSDFENSTLTFCHDWLAGKNEFTLTTSGSTGIPKKITLRREQMEASARLTLDALQLHAGDTALVCLDTKYIAGQMMLVRSFLGGMNVVAVEPVANPFKNLGEHQIDFAAFVPLQIEAILEENHSKKLNALKCGIIGGASISASLKPKLEKIKSLLYATYGMTETVSHIALQKLNGHHAENSFRVLGNTKIRKDERGCLVIQTGYLDDPVITNDLVNIIDASHFIWLGRLDNVINSGGVKISPEHVERIVESVFTEEHLANRFFLAGIADKKLGQRVVLFVEGSVEEEIQSVIARKLSMRMAKYEMPKEIKFVSKFSETQSGKINRNETIRHLKV